MLLDEDTCCRAARNFDAGLEGVSFATVKTTGICRRWVFEGPS